MVALHLLDIILRVKLGRQFSVYWFTLQLRLCFNTGRFYVALLSTLFEPQEKEPAPRSTNTASATPTPIPAFAPLDNGVARLLCIAAGLLCVVLGLLWKVARICRGADVGVKAVKSVEAHATFTSVAIPVNGKVVMVTV